MTQKVKKNCFRPFFSYGIGKVDRFEIWNFCHCDLFDIWCL